MNFLFLVLLFLTFICCKVTEAFFNLLLISWRVGIHESLLFYLLSRLLTLNVCWPYLLWSCNPWRHIFWYCVSWYHPDNPQNQLNTFPNLKGNEFSFRYTRNYISICYLNFFRKRETEFDIQQYNPLKKRKKDRICILLIKWKFTLDTSWVLYVVFLFVLHLCRSSNGSQDMASCRRERGSRLVFFICGIHI